MICKTGLALVLAILLLGRPAVADKPTTIRLTNGEWAPYQSENLPEYGAASALMTRAFAAVGIKVEYGFFPWNRAVILVERGAWDGTFIWVMTPERDRKFLASDPLFTIREVIFHSKRNPIQASRPEDLRGLVMGALDSSAFGAQFNDLVEAGEITVARVRNNRQLFRMLLSGRVDFVPELETSGYDAVHEHLEPVERQQIVHLENLTHGWNYHLLISRLIDDGPYFVEAFNRGLAILKQNGEFERIMWPVIRPRRPD